MIEYLEGGHQTETHTQTKQATRVSHKADHRDLLIPFNPVEG